MTLSVGVQARLWELGLAPVHPLPSHTPSVTNPTHTQVQKSKAGTGRVVAFRELGLVNAFTLEASFAGPAAGKGAGRHFNTGDLEEMGAAVVSALCAVPEEAPALYG